MFTYEKTKLIDQSKIHIGYVYKFIGEIIYGIDENNIRDLEHIMKDLDEDCKNQIIIFDLTRLEQWDSLGVSNVVGKSLKINTNLKKKGRTLISCIGNKDYDIYRAVIDKYTLKRINHDLPWFASVEDFLDSLMK